MKNENNLARKIFISTLLLTLFFICLSSANAADVHMNSTNNTISNVVVNETTNGDTVYLDEGTYNHTHLNGSNGITINKNLTIIGKGINKSIIDAEKQGRIFNITPNGTLTLINLSIINGQIAGYGGSIYNNGSLNITNCTLTNSNATNFGGAIYNLKTLTISYCKLLNNIAGSWGGAIYNYNANIIINNSDFINNTGNTRGGAILGRGATNMTIFNSNLINNTVTGTGGAITAYDATTTLHISNCNFINNIANATSGAGGAIAIYYFGNRSIENCTFINNTATSTNPYYSGGAIYNNAGYLTISHSIFTNNTAVYGGAIYNDGNVMIESSDIFNNHGTYGTIFSANNTTIKYSRIFNNTNCDIYIATYDYPGYISLVNASFNWWGTNNPDLEIKAGGRIRGTGNFTIDNFFIMNVINLTALDSSKNLIFNYTFGLNNTDHFDPSLLPYFETSFYNDLVGFLESFDARYNKTLTDTITVRNKTIEYIFTTDNETQSFNARISPGNTNITVNSPNGKNGEIVDLVAKLTDDEGEPLVNREVIFNINGKQFTATTNSEGIALINHTIDKNDFINGKLNITARFGGDDEHFASNGTGIITLDKTETRLVVNNSNGKNGEIVDLIVKLTDENGNPLVGKAVRFNLAGKIFIMLTDENGVAKINYTIDRNDFVNNRLNFTVSFEGNEEYLSTNGTGIITLDKTNTNLVVNSSNGKNGETVNLVAKLTDIEGIPLINREVIFNINGKQFTATTNSEGIALINYTIDKNDFINGKLNITARFCGDDGYYASNGTGIITLDKTQTNVVVNNSKGKIGNLVTIIAKLTDENGNLLSNKIIKFYIDGAYIGNAITDVNGVARFSYKPTKEGNFTITAIFEGDDAYLNSTSKNLLTVTTEVEPTPTPTPEPTNQTKPTNQTNNNLINTNKTTATMKQTGIPIITILIVLLSSLGLFYRKK